MNTKELSFNVRLVRYTKSVDPGDLNGDNEYNYAMRISDASGRACESGNDHATPEEAFLGAFQAYLLESVLDP